MITTADRKTLTEMHYSSKKQKGDCFVAAGRTMLYASGNTQLKLVHAMVTNPITKEHFAHGFNLMEGVVGKGEYVTVEEGSRCFVIDNSNSGLYSMSSHPDIWFKKYFGTVFNVCRDKDKYFEHLSINQTEGQYVEYPMHEALLKLAKQRDFGPWEIQEEHK